MKFSFYLVLLQTLFFFNQITAQFNFDCGIPDVEPQTKIVNGQVASDNAWPWMVAMYFEDSFTCGGSIIAPDLILTAAHCVENTDISKYKFIYGTNNLNDPQTESNTAFASKIIIHPDYFLNIIYNDIALIRLTEKIQFSNKVKPICLPQSRKLDEIENKEVIATGWGQIGGNSPISNVLLEATLLIKNNKSRNSCDHRRYINYCALDEAENSNICQGDSGGPLQYFKNGKWFVYGLSSFTISNEKTSCLNTEPSFFTTVPFYLDWIKRVATSKPSPPLVKKKCGLNSRPRIIGGKISKNNAWPWIVQIRLFRDNYLQFPLSGTLVSDQHVLTLRNKLIGVPKKNIYVALGSNELFLNPDLDKLYLVIDIRQVSNDLVVLKLHRQVNNPNVSPICLPNSNQASLIFNKQITTAGWGSIDGTVDSSPTMLRETRLTVDNKRNECKKYTKSSYCTFGKKTNICYQDIGNPLMFPVANKWTLFGVYYKFSTDSNGDCNPNKMSLAYNIIKDLDSIKSALN